MATALQAEAQFSEILQCPICLETFKRPKVLPCGHTYCASCLQSHINNKVTHRGTPQVCFPCPVCRVDTPSCDSNINIEQWAESLPVNSIVSSILDVSVIKKAGKYCDQCLKQEKESLATCFCKDCHQSMCMTCKQCHDGFPSLSRHYVINIIDSAESCFVTPDLSTIEACHRHCSKRIKFFCDDHKTLCCNTCVILEHRKCERVITVDNMIKSFDVKKKSKEVEVNLDKFEVKLKQITRKIKINADIIQKDKANILNHIHSIKAQVIAKLQQLEDDVVASLESSYKSENANLQTEETKGQSLITAIDSDRTQFELVMTHGSEVQKVIMLYNLDQNQHRYVSVISEYQNDIKEVRISLNVDKTFQKYVNKMSDLGKINLIRNNLDCSACSEDSETKFIPPLKKRKAVKVSEFNVQVSSDMNSCHISDILHFKDGRMLMVDYNNYKIKLFGHDYKCQESVIFQERPWCACTLSDIEVAVTIPVQRLIQIIGINDKMPKIRKITTRFQCWTIAVVKDQFAVTTRGHIILILDMDGKEIRTVRTHTRCSDEHLEPGYIIADTTNSAIYISYETGHKLVAYSMTWNILFTYTNQDMENPTGIDIDREGNIYLCGCVSQCVQQISAKGKFIKTLISKKKENKNPVLISFYRDKDSFIVTYGDCDVVEVYDLRVS